MRCVADEGRREKRHAYPQDRAGVLRPGAAEPLDAGGRCEAHRFRHFGRIKPGKDVWLSIVGEDDTLEIPVQGGKGHGG